MQSYFPNYIRAVKHPLPEMRAYFDAENNYLKNLVRKDAVILDVGCGNGRTIKFLAPFVKEIVGIDYDPQMIAAAKETLKGISNTKLILGDFLTYPLPEKFDLTYASYNLLGSAETEDKEQILERMIDLTKPNGHIVASVWSAEGIDFAQKYYPSIGISIKQINGNDVITDQGTFKRFSRDELDTLAKKTAKNYKIVALTPIFYLMDIS